MEARVAHLSVLTWTQKKIFEDIVAHIGADDDTTDSPRAEVYDSETTRHLSPFHHNLENFTEIFSNLKSF